MSSSRTMSGTIAWTVWILVSVFYAYQYILRVMPNIMLSDIMEQFGITAAAFGQFSGIYYIGYSLVHLPVGIMLDRYGPRKVMTGCILLTVLGLTPLIFAEHWAYPIMGRFIIGVGSSAAILGVFKIIRMSFSEKQFPRMLSLSVTIGLIGAIYGGGPVSYMRTAFGYETIIEIIGAAGILLAAITYWIVPEFENTSEATVFSEVKEVLTNKKVLWACFCAGLMVGPCEGFADVWGTVFLKEVYGFEDTLAASLPSIIFIGMCFGSPLLSLIAERVGNYLATIAGAGLAMAVSFSILLSMQLTSSIVLINFILIGMCCAYQILAIYKASTYVSERVAGLATALANMIIMLFGYTFHSIIGGLIAYMGGPQADMALKYGIAVIPCGLALGTIGFLILLSWERSDKRTETVLASNS